METRKLPDKTGNTHGNKTETPRQIRKPQWKQRGNLEFPRDQKSNTARKLANQNTTTTMQSFSDIKTCSSCRLALPRNAFGSDPYTTDKLNHKCKACRRAAQADWHTRNPEAAALKSAREAVIRKHGREGVTPERIRSTLARLKASRAMAALQEGFKARSASRSASCGALEQGNTAGTLRNYCRNPPPLPESQYFGDRGCCGLWPPHCWPWMPAGLF